VRLLIKLGGTLLDSPESLDGLARQIAALPASGHETVVVHGGGKQMTRFLAERGVESRFVGGLRVTTPEVADAVLKVFAGTVNKTLTGALLRAGARAVGISGLDGLLAESVALSPELGLVGRVVKTNPEVLDCLIGGGFLPVVACVGGSAGGSVYNVNADEMAVACASGFRAERLLFLTDVPGVMDASKTVLPRLTPSDCDRLIAEGVAAGGMEAKLRSACAALAGGVGQVLIAPGAAPDVVARLLGGESLGTALVPEEAAC
jgi:acetylglutamate kinase